MILDTSTPIALVGTFAQFSHQTKDIINNMQTPLSTDRGDSRKSNVQQIRISSLRTSRRRLESTLTEEKEKSEVEDCSASRREEIGDVEIDDEEIESSPHLGDGETPDQNGRSRRQTTDNDVNVWEDDHSGTDFAVRLVSIP